MRSIYSVFLLSHHCAWGEQVAVEGYVGAAACGECHSEQITLWRGSDHDLAMEPATAQTVLGNFANTRFSINNVSSLFFKKGSEFWVNTQGADGKPADFKIDYVFGVKPLQQYLIRLDNGRLQAFTIAWDSRSQEQGGQRWFHLYPDTSGPDDVLHWTRQGQNWNAGCAECHSTHLQKNYDVSQNSYQTTWAEIDVACEACHGPGQQHLDWANENATPSLAKKNKGLLQALNSGIGWRRDVGQATATAIPLSNEAFDQQINQCAHCHSRRAVLNNNDPQAMDFLDHHQLRMLDAPLYYPDGQIRDEVYVYGSFLQSKMYQRGVVCSNCHDPHSLKLKAPGNQLCAQCHAPDVFDTSQHHHHAESSSGAECVNCHMPETTYMQVDPRRDHSLRIPRPDLSLSLAAGQPPNACNQCHQDQSVSWAAEQFRRWYPARAKQTHFATAFAAADNYHAQALPRLVNIANEDTNAVIVRASAVQRLVNYPNQYALNAARVALGSEQAMLREAAVRVFESLPLAQREQDLWPLLSDPVAAVRFQAVRLLAGIKPADIERRKQLADAANDYIHALQHNADIPGGQMQIGVVQQALGELNLAAAAYQQALVLEPQFIPALLNLADLYRQQGLDKQALPLLEQALAVDRNSLAANFAMGLLQVRNQRLDNALQYLQRAAQGHQDSQYSYVYAVALYESGQRQQALNELKAALEKYPDDPQLQNALHSYSLTR
ncbi:tetratricopeptide repeat protein [Oceanicoccus sp. KOV_DT_Chl]|uniref:multiheme c-type cytochrome n=1 Tax=Oceanicoccus sp. KOV_DT_Chl TaxID=1904639 RepID=UPI00135C1279|nr:tetratricopeptide repeat protein [Oceanicoccus sp. KOV_DT_Chl]